MIVVVPPEQAALSWAIFEPMFRKVTVTTHGSWEPVDVLRDILNGDQIMWAAWDRERGTVDAIITTHIKDIRGVAGVLRNRICDVMFIAGDRLEQWLPEFIAVIEKYGRDHGCTIGQGALRRGWLRVWPGTEENGVNIIKDLTK